MARMVRKHATILGDDIELIAAALRVETSYHTIRAFRSWDVFGEIFSSAEGTSSVTD